MDQVLNVQILGTSYAAVDGAEYASVYIGQEAEQGSATAKGIEVLKLGCTPEVFRQLPPAGYPLNVQLTTKLRKAAGGKMGQVAVSVRIPSQTPAKASA
jgi:hypothetical protein